MTGSNGRSRHVHVHVHLAVAGTFPLRVADLLFTDDVVVIPEYEYVTPLFGLARGTLSEAGEQARDRYRRRDVAGLVELAERTHRIAYTDVDRVRIYDSRTGRPKVAVDVTNGPPYGYRIHAPVDVDALTAALRSLGERRGFAVEQRSALGFSPKNGLRRFFANR